MKSVRKMFLLCSFAAATGVATATPPETVVVGNAGNRADDSGYGAVGYKYRIGKYEVTNAEYCAFLNGVAKTDVYDLYDVRMDGEYGGITRSGLSGEYVYKTKAGGGRKPVSYVTWESCARFANWLSNGGGEGDTEEGAYSIKGGRATPPNHAELAAGKVVKWVIASENEWYKAAYFDPAKGESGGYWRYATKGDSAPACNLNSNMVSEVGSYPTAASPYGTFDQNGNMWEYNDTVSGGKVGLRGGSFFMNDQAAYLLSSARYDVLSAKWPNYGFRVVALGSGKAGPASRATTPEPEPEPESESAPAPVAKPTWSGSKGTTYYVSQSGGDDRWSGKRATAAGTAGPWKTLARASIKFRPGDTLLLKRGDTWNEELAPKGSGTPDQPITIGAYGEGGRPMIDREDFKQDLTGIRLSDQGGFKIVGIDFNHCMTGIYGEYSDGCPNKKFIWIEDCYFHDSLLYQHYEDYPERKIGLGICFFSFELDKKVVLSDIMIKDCVFRRLASAVWTNSPDNFNKNASYVYNFRNMTMDGCLFEEGFQWQQGIRGVDGGAMRNCVTHDVGRNFRSFNGVAGSMFFRCKDWVFEDCEWGFVSIGLGSGDGEAFDFEGNCDNMKMRHCLFHDTDGPGFLLCCYASDGNPHTGIVMEDCVVNGKSKRPIGLPRCAIINTTDWNEMTWRNCRFYLSPGEALMKVMDPEKDKRATFSGCHVQNLAVAGTSPKLTAEVSSGSAIAGAEVAAAWQAEAAGGGWIQLDFGRATRVNEFKIKEEASSAVSRYCIECWDARSAKWVSVFNGMSIGGEFVAPIVSRVTTKARLRVLQAKGGTSGIAEFTAYNDTSGTRFEVRRGEQAPDHVGK